MQDEDWIVFFCWLASALARDVEFALMLSKREEACLCVEVVLGGLKYTGMPSICWNYC